MRTKLSDKSVSFNRNQLHNETLVVKSFFPHLELILGLETRITECLVTN